VVGIFPGAPRSSALAGAVLAEQNDEWAGPRRHTGLEIFAACRKASSPAWERMILVRLD
jgi:hypothetical protein